MTLDKLAGMVAKGFESAATKESLKELATKEELNGVETRMKSGFENMEERLGGVEQRLGKIEYRTDEIYEILARFEEGDILDLQNRIKILERAVRALGKQIS